MFINFQNKSTNINIVHVCSPMSYIVLTYLYHEYIDTSLTAPSIGNDVNMIIYVIRYTFRAVVPIKCRIFVYV